jgi:hypothetical protein
VFLVLLVFTPEWRQTKQGTPAIVGSRYRVKTNKTRNTGNSRLKIESDDKQNKGHSVSWSYYCQCSLFCLSSLCILTLLLPVSLVLFVFTLYLDPTIAGVPCLTKQGTLAIVGSRYRVKTNKTRDTGNSRVKIQSEDKQDNQQKTIDICIYYPTIAGVPCFVCLHSVSWAYYCQCPLFCLSSLSIFSLLLPVFLVLLVFTLYLEPTISSVP